MSELTKRLAAHRASGLADIKDEIKDLLERARRMLDGTPFEDDLRCWAANIEIALDDGHGYLGGCERTLQDTIDDFENWEDDE